ncbi:MAG: porin [Variovorax sp.]|nr:MAG: porin [Variovorax sp.]
MRKLRLTLATTTTALLATATATTASAQSDVTLYGRVNTTVENQKVGEASTTGLFNNSSRFGFRGVEDLGGGLKIGFGLESGFSSDTGIPATPFFARRSEVDLSGNFGRVRLGRWIAESYFATADYVSLHNHDTGSSADALYAYVSRDANKVAYRTPVWNDFTLEGSVGLHEQSSGTPTTPGNPSSNGKNSYDFAANYKLGALALGAGYTKLDQVNQFALRAFYAIGPFLLGGYVQRDENAFFVNGGKRSSVRLSGAYLLGASEFHLNVGRAGDYDNVPDSAATQYTLGYNYNLSKRTKVYGYYTRVNNGAAASYQSGVVGADFRSVAVGVRHNF